MSVSKTQVKTQEKIQNTSETMHSVIRPLQWLTKDRKNGQCNERVHDGCHFNIYTIYMIFFFFLLLHIYVIICFFLNVFLITDQEAGISSGRCNKPRLPSRDNLWGVTVQPLSSSGRGLRPTRAESPPATEE